MPSLVNIGLVIGVVSGLCFLGYLRYRMKLNNDFLLYQRDLPAKTRMTPAQSAELERLFKKANAPLFPWSSNDDDDEWKD